MLKKPIFIFVLLIVLFNHVITCNHSLASPELNLKQSKLTYTLTILGIPFKKKDLPVDLNIKYIKSGNDYFLTSFDFTAYFTSKNPIFRKIIDYDRHPSFFFIASINEPIKLTSNSIINLSGNLNFHGMDSNKSVNLLLEITGNGINFTGSTIIQMSEYGLERPRILFAKVDDFIPTDLALKHTIN